MATNKSALAKARAAKKKAQVALSAEKHAGIGLSQRADTYVIKVLLAAPLSHDSKCPNVIDGVPVEFEVVGQISKLTTDKEPKGIAQPQTRGARKAKSQ